MATKLGKMTEGFGTMETKDAIKKIEDGLNALCVSGGVHPKRGPVLLLAFSKDQAMVEGNAIKIMLHDVDILKFHMAVDKIVHTIAEEYVGMAVRQNEGPSKANH